MRFLFQQLCALIRGRERREGRVSACLLILAVALCNGERQGQDDGERQCLCIIVIFVGAVCIG